MRFKKFILSVVSMLLVLVMCACSNPQPSEDQAADSEAPEKEVFLFGGESDYRIVYSESANNNVKSLITQLKDAVKEATGKAPEYAVDTSKDKTEIPCEILLGVTKRAESKTSSDQMQTIGYDIRFIGEKLVITASNDMLLGKAVTDLIDTWAVSDSKISLSNKTELVFDASDSMRSLYSNGKFEYDIVVPLKCSDGLYNDAVYLSQSLSAVTGSIVDIVYDEKRDEVDGAYEICLGKTNRKVSKDLYESLENTFECKTVSSDNRIAVGALQDSIISEAVRTLYSDIYGEIKCAYSGSPIIAKDYGSSRVISEIAAGLPTLMAGSFYGFYKYDDDKFIIYTDDVTEKDYDDYVTVLKNDGATVLKEYSFESNRYTLLESDKYSAYVSYLPKSGAIRTYVGPADTQYPLVSEEIQANDATPALWQLDVDTKGSYSNGGMCYVLKLTDGSFIIIDAGFNTQREADNLYAVLRDNTPEGQIPTISGWFITHLHPDHYGGLIPFASSYSGLTDVKAFYYNFPGIFSGSSSNTIDVGSAKSIITAMKRWKNAERYDTLHSGMTIGFAGATADVICTHEDVYPLAFSDGNDTCTVIGVSIAGQRILFLGDARDGQSVTMLNTIPSSILKSDIVQYSHHGYEGCSETFYRVVDASVVLWPMNIDGKVDGVDSPVFKNWYASDKIAANRYIRESDKIKKIIISGEGTQRFDLPYTPTGDRIVDYEAIYNERLSKN